MANLPAAGAITALATNAEAQQLFEALRDWLSQLPASAEVQLTIASGTITTATRDQGSIAVETEAAAASDDLANIAQTNIQNGSELLLRAYDASHTVVVKHAAGGAGQILLQYDADFSLDNTDKWLRLKRVGTDWIETHRCWGNDPLAQRQALGFKATADIASAATVDLSTATGNVTRITGTTATSTFTMNAGQWHMCIADGAWPLTYNATTNKLNTGGAPYTCSAGDRILLHKDDDNIVHGTVIPTSGRAVAGTGYGQCILDKSGADLVLSPCDGNLLTINGVACEVPDAGVSLSAAAVSDGHKYIYAYMSSGTMTLEASTTAHAASTTAGNKGTRIKSGDDSRTLVGAAYCQSNAWSDVNYSRCVLSWFNRRDITGRAWLTANRTVAAVGPQEIHTEARIYFICWADEAVHFHSNGTASNSNAFQTTDMCIGIDGVATIGGISRQANTTATSVNSLSATTQAPAGQLSENALHYAVLCGGASANTATYYGGADNTVRCEINFRTRG